MRRLVAIRALLFTFAASSSAGCYFEDPHFDPDLPPSHGQPWPGAAPCADGGQSPPSGQPPALPPGRGDAGAPPASCAGPPVERFKELLVIDRTVIQDSRARNDVADAPGASAGAWSNWPVVERLPRLPRTTGSRCGRPPPGSPSLPADHGRSRSRSRRGRASSRSCSVPGSGRRQRTAATPPARPAATGDWTSPRRPSG